MSSTVNLELPARPNSLETVIRMLEHLYAVTLGRAFYLNSVSLSASTIQKCCESFWHNDSTEAVSDHELDLARVRSMVQFTRLIKDLEESPADQYILLNLRERLRFMSPFVNSSRTGQSRATRQDSAERDFLLIDQRTMTLSAITSLLKLCQILAPNYKSSSLCQPIINGIQEHFIRPYSLILWSRARRDLLA
ncbi:hypothetical protein HG536_0C01690 [Torulaspora globosa]|uniref:Uncharacterized protein n=1 Tax=Torulaspora globosa TaxID=48254 RepID=A0A7G3ZER5_9SACH|nr:uncharacterized protein HG536_0C01690 [Torulaspora globosa]QLL32001.1 hypothetical protein HG536_0C01690 [Torulaspora globosa]